VAILLTDTDVYSYLHSANQKKATPYKAHVQGNIIVLAFISVGELYAGYRKRIAKGDWTEAHIQKLEAQLKGVAIVPYDVEICRTYGALKAVLKTPEGTDRNIGPNDLWIAACAVRHSLTLVTNNRKDFSDIPGLNIICEAPPLL
jgi:predicted nucleic acid-binding protein